STSVWKFWDTTKQQVVRSGSAVFDENDFPGLNGQKPRQDHPELARDPPTDAADASVDEDLPMGDAEVVPPGDAQPGIAAAPALLQLGEEILDQAVPS